MLMRFFFLAMLSIGSNLISAQNVKIVNAQSGLVLETTGASTAPAAILDQWQWNGGATQQWKVVPVGGGYSYLQNVGSGQVATLYNNTTSNGTLIDQWPWNGSIAEQWQILSQGSSYNEILNPYSGKALDDTGFSTTNGTPIQQWDWLYGLNQQWSLIPVQNSYQITGQTNLYFSAANGGTITAESTLDYDYNSQYYYYKTIETILSDNNGEVGGGTWGIHQLQQGFASVLIERGGLPGHHYDATSTFNLVTAYRWSQTVANCGAFCDSYYDPYNYHFVEQNPEGSDIPAFSTVVYAAPIITAVALATQVLHLGANGTSYRVPGPASTFDLKFRAFISPAWVRGPDPCLANGQLTSFTIYGGDNRGFDPFSPSYRAHSEAQVSTSTGNWIGSSGLGPQNPYYSAGVTTRYGSDALAADGYTLMSDTALHDCHYTDDIFRESNSQMSGSVKGGSGSVTTNFYGTVNDLTSDLYTVTPGLGYNVTYTISTANPAIPAYTFQYSHKCYPAYEAYIGGQRIYGYMPSHNDPASITLCLAGGLTVSNETIGTVN